MTAEIRQRLKNRKKAARYRARWKRLGLRAPFRTRQLAKQNAQNAERRTLNLCPDCEEPSARFVYCSMCRARRAKNNKALWLRKQAA